MIHRLLRSSRAKSAAAIGTCACASAAVIWRFVNPGHSFQEAWAPVLFKKSVYFASALSGVDSSRTSPHSGNSRGNDSLSLVSAASASSFQDIEGGLRPFKNATEEDVESLKSMLQKHTICQLQEAATQMISGEYPKNSFQVVKQKSSVEGAGEGLFATANLKAGTLLTLYGGYVESTSAWDAGILGCGPPTMLSNTHVYSPRQDVLIDGIHPDTPKQPAQCPSWALGQFVNHPNQLQHPNAAFLPLPIPEKSPAAHFPPVVHSRDQPPGAGEAFSCVAIVAVSNIDKGKEILVDYNMTPPRPSWCKPIKEHQLLAILRDEQGLPKESR